MGEQPPPRKERGLFPRCLRALTLLAVSIMAFSIRLFSVVKYESVIHEFDPYCEWSSCGARACTRVCAHADSCRRPRARMRASAPHGAACCTLPHPFTHACMNARAPASSCQASAPSSEGVHACMLAAARLPATAVPRTRLCCDLCDCRLAFMGSRD